MNTAKNFFLCAMAIGILVFSGDKVYRLWKNYNDEKALLKQLAEKRERMDKYYTDEYKLMYQIFRDQKLSDRERCNFQSEIERRMVQDGYATNAEIGLIENQGLEAYSRDRS